MSRDSAFTDDDRFGLPDDLIDRALALVAAGDGAALDALLDPIHPADVADLLEQVAPSDRRALLALWHGGMDGDILSELDDSLRDEVIGTLSPADLAEAVADLDSDDVVDLVEDLAPEGQQAVLAALSAPDRAAVETALRFPEGSAGRLMQVEVVTAPAHATVGDAIDLLRGDIALPDQFYHVVLVDPRHKPVAYVTLGRILSSPRDTRLADITEDSFRTFAATDDEEEVARAFNRYHLISAPVVDADGRLAGVITIDDAMIVLDEEHEEDFLALAGVGTTNPGDSVLATARGRFPWLLVNLVNANIAALVIGRFEATIEAVVLLAVLMPIVASMGGNAGTQSLAVAVRALATRDLTPANAARTVGREALTGLLTGFAMAVLMGLVVALLYGEPQIGLVIAAALQSTFIFATVAGVLVPLGLERLGADPAVASGPFVTTMTDVLGFFLFLGFATLVLL